MAAAAAAAVNASGIDPKVLGRPEKWDGNKMTWRHFSNSIRGYIR